jgi:hypothetical protein
MDIELDAKSHRWVEIRFCAHIRSGSIRETIAETNEASRMGGLVCVLDNNGIAGIAAAPAVGLLQ